MIDPIEEVGGHLDRVEKELSRIRKLYERTIRYKLDDPETSLMHARKAAEAICRQLFTKAISKNPGNLTMEGFIEKLISVGVLPKRIVVPLRTIQGYGNLAAHEQDEDSQTVITTEYIQPCLQALAVVVEWYFSENTKFECSQSSSIQEFQNEDVVNRANGTEKNPKRDEDRKTAQILTTSLKEKETVGDFAKIRHLTVANVIRLARDILKIEFRTPSAIITDAQVKILDDHIACINKAKTNQVSYSPKSVDLGEGISLDFVMVPPGIYCMGSPPEEEGHNDDEVQHEVEISRPIYLQRHPVTQEQYQRIVGSNPSYFNGPKLPVEMVSWFDSYSYCEILTARFGVIFRLPTEAEWEYACRAGTQTAFSFGNTITSEQSNFDGKFVYGGGSPGDCRWSTTPVCSYPSNPWNLYDMHGNVWEWCSDWYGEYSSCRVTDPQGPHSGDIRMLRGGSWFHGPADARSAQRDALDPGRRHSLYGFRVVMEI